MLQQQVGAGRRLAQDGRHLQPEIVVTGELQRGVLARQLVRRTAAAAAARVTDRRRVRTRLTRRRRRRRRRRGGHHRVRLRGRVRGRFVGYRLAHRVHHLVLLLQVLRPTDKYYEYVAYENRSPSRFTTGARARSCFPCQRKRRGVADTEYQTGWLLVRYDSETN